MVEMECKGCDLDYISVIAKHCSNDVASTEFLLKHNVIPRDILCPRCRVPCCKIYKQNLFVCGKLVIKRQKKKRCPFSVSMYKGTFLNKSRIAPNKFIILVNDLLSKYFDSEVLENSLKITKATITLWKENCLSVLEKWMETKEPIGGPGIVVEIDEKMILNTENDASGESNEIWLFGGIERLTRKMFVVHLGNKHLDTERLLDLVTKNIKPGSIIVSDNWNDHFITDPESCEEIKFAAKNCATGVPTFGIKLFWGRLKKWIIGPGMPHARINQHIARYVFMKTYGQNALHQFMVEVSRQYRHPNFLDSSLVSKEVTISKQCAPRQDVPIENVEIEIDALKKLSSDNTVSDT